MWTWPTAATVDLLFSNALDGPRCAERSVCDCARPNGIAASALAPHHSTSISKPSSAKTRNSR
eukprot:14609006-Alexandrium_andersonii.AAC.1